MFFTFDGGVTVSLSSAYQHRTKRDVEDHRAGVTQSVPVAGSTLMSVIGRSVVAANGDDDGTLTSEFDDGQIVAFIEDRTPYESFVIKNGEDEYFV